MSENSNTARSCTIKIRGRSCESYVTGLVNRKSMVGAASREQRLVIVIQKIRQARMQKEEIGGNPTARGKSVDRCFQPSLRLLIVYRFGVCMVSA